MLVIVCRFPISGYPSTPIEWGNARGSCARPHDPTDWPSVRRIWGPHSTWQPWGEGFLQGHRAHASLCFFPSVILHCIEFCIFFFVVFFFLQIQSQSKTIVITATTGVTAAWGFYYYLSHFCNLHVSWAGTQLNLPSSLPPIPSPGVTINANDR